jgi:hypothetical protein
MIFHTYKWQQKHAPSREIGGMLFRSRVFLDLPAHPAAYDLDPGQTEREKCCCNLLLQPLQTD